MLWLWQWLGCVQNLREIVILERWKQVPEILERWKQVPEILEKYLPQSSFQNLREIVILERWKQVPEIACNITHDYYSL